MTPAPEDLVDSVRTAVDHGFFKRALDLCDLGLNRDLSPAIAESLRALRAEARRRSLPASVPAAPPPAPFWCGIEAFRRGAFGAAAISFREALDVMPSSADVHAHLGMALIAQNVLPEGWDEYEWRRYLPWGGARHMLAPRWDGRAMPGKTLLLWDEQGNGDAIQFIRYAIPAARRSGARVLFHGRPRLCRLFRSTGVLDAAIPRTDSFPAPDAHAAIMSLPAILRLAPEAPSEVPYLHAEPELAGRWASRLGSDPRPHVGLVWQGNPHYAHDGGRSFPLSAYLPLLHAFQGRASFYSLQKGAGEEQLTTIPTTLRPLDLGATLDSGDDGFVETAAVLANLDLLVTSDTGIAHLAGAMGVCTWVVLGAGADWRWGEDLARTPFYPTARLFRRAPADEWSDVVGRVRDALATRLAQEATA